LAEDDLPDHNPAALESSPKIVHKRGYTPTRDEIKSLAKVHYDVINAAGEAVTPERSLSGTNPTQIPEVTGPPRRASIACEFG
jgi:hypothetical protein